MSEPHQIHPPDNRSWYDLYRELAGKVIELKAATQRLDEARRDAIEYADRFRAMEKARTEWRKLSRQNAVEATTAENRVVELEAAFREIAELPASSTKIGQIVRRVLKQGEYDVHG